VTLRSARSLAIRNELIETELIVDDEGLVIAGTNQRFGARGVLHVKPGGLIRFRSNEFEVRRGWVRFNDLTRIAPQVDLTAVTEYHRYDDASGGSGNTEAAAATAEADSGTSALGGRWDISMHAHGDADNLKIDLTSEPALAQDDIFLLLTFGLTRAEFDQAKSASAGGSVALEALATVSGADRAVQDAVPVIDDVRFGSNYSSRTGRTEPTITISKRLASRLRASVTTGVSDSSEVRSNVEWRLNPRVSVEGSYDNTNDISTSGLGNVGADVRWRLEWE
jgi:translocation and assembly module TamB